MNKIQSEAWKVLVNYRATKLADMTDLKRICDQNGYLLYTYEEGKQYIENFNLERFMVRDAFSHIYNGIMTILYNDSLSLIKQLVGICHEIGHNKLNHASIEIEGTINEDWKDKEADQFAYEMLFPSIIVTKIAFTKFQFLDIFGEKEDTFDRISNYLYLHTLTEDFDVEPEIAYAMNQKFNKYISELEIKIELNMKVENDKNNLALEILMQKEKEEKLLSTLAELKEKEKNQKKNVLKICISALCIAAIGGSGLFYRNFQQKKAQIAFAQNNTLEAPNQPFSASIPLNNNTSTEKNQSNVETPEPINTESKESDLKENESKNTEFIVSVTKSGEKYHVSTCRYVSNKTNIKTMTMQEAINLGFQSCSVCTPDKEIQ